MRREGWQRAGVAMAILLVTAVLAWATMDAGKIREGVLVILAGLAVRIALAARYVKQG